MCLPVTEQVGADPLQVPSLSQILVGDPVMPLYPVKHAYEATLPYVVTAAATTVPSFAEGLPQSANCSTSLTAVSSV